MALLERLAALLSPSDLERFLAAQERQAAALERVAQLVEVALGMDPPTVAAAAEAAAAPPPAPGSVEIGAPDAAAIRKIEEITLALAAAKGAMPTDEEIYAELDRQEAAEAHAAEIAAGYGRHW